MKYRQLLCKLCALSFTAVSLSSVQSLTASDTATQTLNFALGEYADITLNSNTVSAGALNLNSTTIVIDGYVVSHNSSTSPKKITGQISAAMPANLALVVTFGAVGGGTAVTGADIGGSVASAINVVTGIAPVLNGGSSIHYTFTDSGAASGSYSRDITYTLVDDV